MDLGRATFQIDVEPLGQKALRDYGTALFKKLDREVLDSLPIPDYGLELEVEEGSLKGRSRILAAATVVYFGIGQFGSFVQGVREIRTGASYAMSWLTTNAALSLANGRQRIRSTSRNGGDIARLEGLFMAVQARELTPEEALERALPLFGLPDERPPRLDMAVADALRTIQRNPEQLILPADGMVPVAIERSESAPTRTRKPRPPKEDVLPGERWRLAIKKAHKDEKESITLEHL